jgi:hypothetical protein
MQKFTCTNMQSAKFAGFTVISLVSSTPYQRLCNLRANVLHVLRPGFCTNCDVSLFIRLRENKAKINYISNRIKHLQTFSAR